MRDKMHGKCAMKYAIEADPVRLGWWIDNEIKA